GRAGALPRQNGEVVAVERLRARTARIEGVALRGLGHERAERTLLSLRRRPIQTVVPSGIAAQRLRVAARGPAVVPAGGIQLLRRYVLATELDHGQLVAPDSPREHFVGPRGDVALPPAPVPHQRDREGPRLVAHLEHLASVR